MRNYEESRIKLTKTQLNKLKTAAKNKTSPTLKRNNKNFQGEQLSHKLLLKT